MTEKLKIKRWFGETSCLLGVVCGIVGGFSLLLTSESDKTVFGISLGLFYFLLLLLISIPALIRYLSGKEEEWVFEWTESEVRVLRDDSVLLDGRLKEIRSVLEDQKYIHVHSKTGKYFRIKKEAVSKTLLELLVSRV